MPLTYTGQTVRRIINGKAYDTDTADLWQVELIAMSYLTRGGRFIEHALGRGFELVAGHDGILEVFAPRTPGQARSWLETHANHLVERYFGSAPEASAEDHKSLRSRAEPSWRR